MKPLYFLSIFILAGCVTSSGSQFSSQLKKGIELADAGVKQCIQKREQGAFKTYKETALCGNKAIKKHVSPHAKFPQLVREFMNYRLDVAVQADAGTVSYEKGHAMIMAKREALTAQAMKMREDLSQQEWVNDVQRNDPFKKVGCEFRPSGVTKCHDW